MSNIKKFKEILLHNGYEESYDTSFNEVRYLDFYGYFGLTDNKNYLYFEAYYFDNDGNREVAKKKFKTLEEVLEFFKNKYDKDFKY